MDQDRSPFDLPELMMIIGRFMDKKVLAACVLVSKAWYKTFAPFLWETIKLQERRRYRSKDAPLDGFRNTRNWIRSVHIDFHRPTKLYWNEMPILPNLKVLKTQTMYTSDQRHITSMLTQHPLITHMDLIFEASLGCIAFWDLIAKQIHLVELKLGDIYIQSENVDAFITICSRLRSLSLDEIVLDGMLDNAGLPVFPIRDLSLINMRRQENNLLLFSNKCPDLETFHCIIKRVILALILRFGRLWNLAEA
ncbi:hypothetical protein BG011_003750 [Mortierella polycephala]|uniref:F-box domain-containing protein n=1 Tax=Mortierella polycephala TaxID=41804 RepID=A0A9P6Q2D5_9FUNG|nr:hypothetical protein BG011_003750 [Mortierella polycephala]